MKKVEKNEVHDDYTKDKTPKKIYIVEYPDKAKKTSTGTGGVFDGATYEISLETPTFFTAQDDK